MEFQPAGASFTGYPVKLPPASEANLT